MGKKLVLYLAGPMDGVSKADATGWRDVVTNKVSGLYEVRNPMIRDFFKTGYVQHIHEPMIVQGDKGDIEAADVVLANCWKHSFGTPMEVFYARSLRKHVVSIVPSNLRVNGFASPWVSYHSNRVVDSIGLAIQHLVSFAESYYAGNKTTAG
jgi:nucleoside 2-deoxyribosyltransferase